MVQLIFDKTNTNLPTALLVEFDNYNGTQDDLRYNSIPINPFNAFFHNANSYRTQHPIRLAYTLTILKSQGQTIDKAVIDSGKKVQSLGLTFATLTRLKHFKDFLIMPSLERLEKLSRSKSKLRLEE
ncbi:atp-dependent dna helicase pif1 [Brachionus plicatilis]|uniref:Atp-dependent dna helicase pif1 n=1 Tax=Brachionus plicatilis TaxID=10195 RepID=A0A3M7S705_BRAPC|nr:atp-dependent dna helicase pif1 [Brachionus plicatilis]